MKNTITLNNGWGIHMVYAAAYNPGTKGQTLHVQNTFGIGSEANARGRILQEWRVAGIYVHKAGVPQNGAIVRVFDIDPPKLLPWEQYPPNSFRTGQSGYTGSFAAREYFWDNWGVPWDRETHMFCAETPGNRGNTEITSFHANIGVVTVEVSPSGSCPT